MSGTWQRRIGGWFAGWAPPPDVFAVVMATGIVSVAGYDHGYWRLGIALSILAAVAFAGLGVGFLLWAATRRARVMVLTRDPDVALRMFTFVAACAVLGVRWGDHPDAGWLLGALALAGWLVLVPLAVVDVASSPAADLRENAHGAWLLPSVATAGLATTASTLAIDVRLPALVVVAAAPAGIERVAVYAQVRGGVYRRHPDDDGRLPADVWRVELLPRRLGTPPPRSLHLYVLLRISAARTEEEVVGRWHHASSAHESLLALLRA